MASELSAEKAIDLAAKRWADKMKENVRSPLRQEVILHGLTNGKRVEFVDIQPRERLVSMAG